MVIPNPRSHSHGRTAHSAGKKLGTFVVSSNRKKTAPTSLKFVEQVSFSATANTLLQEPCPLEFESWRLISSFCFPQLGIEGREGARNILALGIGIARIEFMGSYVSAWLTG